MKFHFDDSGRNIDYDQLTTYHRLIPTNIDYFQYNEKIIKQLKQKYNVKQYTQLNKIKEQMMKQQMTSGVRSEKYNAKKYNDQRDLHRETGKTKNKIKLRRNLFY